MITSVLGSSWRRVGLCSVAILLATPATISAQAEDAPQPRLLGELAHRAVLEVEEATDPGLRSDEEQAAWEEAHDLAAASGGNRLIISLDDRRLWWVDGADTLFVALVAIGTGKMLEYGEHAWEFSTPRGRHTVLSSEAEPVWVPPLWHYVEYARDTEREMVKLQHGVPVALEDGSRIEVRGDQVGRRLPEGEFEPVRPGEQIIFEDTLFVPPFGTENRRIRGELGAYKLDLGDGYLIHGTPREDSIGQAATHGCIRMAEPDLAFVYRNIRPGTAVYIY